MEGLASGSDMMACPHCGEDVRRGMVRCRECGKTIAEAAAEPDFALTGHELVLREEPTCPLCGAVLEADSTDCAVCTAALLDQLLNGPVGDASSPETDSASSGQSTRRTGLRVRRNSASGTRARGEGGDSRVRGPARTRGRGHRVQPANARGGAAAPSPGRKPAPPQFAAPTRSARSSDDALPETDNLPETEEMLTDTVDDDSSAASTVVETSAACTALLASLARADALLRCEIATALGKLGDKQAIGPLERHMSDQDIRVRRAVAAALVQLGHPKGETLLDIAERKPANEVLSAAKSAPSKPRVRAGGGLESIPLKPVAIAALAVAVVAGGIWYFGGSSSHSSRQKKPKAAATKKAGAAPKKTPKSVE
jgi:hypothetical protein